MTTEMIFKYVMMSIGAWLGWLIGEFTPTFPLITVATLFVLYDSWSAYELD